MQPNRSIKTVIAHIILLVLLFFGAAVLLAYICTFKDDVERESRNFDEQPHLVITGDIQITPLGNMYEGNAESGYQYYKLEIPVTNTGADYADARYDLKFEVEGDTYSDVHEYNIRNYNNDDFYYYNYDVIPSATSGKAQCVVQIKEGVKSFSFIYYEDKNDYYDEKNGTVYKISVPADL